MRIEPAVFGQQPLLPAPLEAELSAWVRRVTGGLTIVAISGLWISLLSWSVGDANSASSLGPDVSNALGRVGATVADVLLTAFGLSVIAVLLAPMCWAVELFGRRPNFPKSRLVFLPVAVATLSAALSALPVPRAWPLGEGLGGLTGDAVFEAASGLLSFVGLDVARGAVAVTASAIGFWALMRAAGVSAAELNRARTQTLSRLSFQDIVPAREHFGSWGARDTAFGAAVSQPGAGRPAKDRFEPDLPFVPRQDKIDAKPGSSGAIPAEGGFDESTDSDDPYANLAESDEASRAIAVRFAPKAANGKAGVVFGRAGVAKPESSVASKQGGGASAAARGDEEETLADERKLLESVLLDFGVKGSVRDAVPGPRVATYCFEPASGTRPNRVVALADDISRALGTGPVRVSSMAGRTALAVEVPNSTPVPVSLRDIIHCESFRRTDARLPIALGQSVRGEPMVADLARMPHVLIAGMTGSGKSMALHAMILSLVSRYGPADCRLLLIDPKGVEFAPYDGLPHLAAPIVADVNAAATALEWVASEMDHRLKRMSALAVRSIEAFNARVGTAAASGAPLSRKIQTGFDAAGQPVYELQQIAGDPMPYLVVVIDEFSELMGRTARQIDAAVRRLAQSARATGIHLVVSTQRPSADSVAGTIKANFPARISFQVASKTDSRTILNEAGAELLLGHGDMLMSSGPGQAVRVHGAYVAHGEIEGIVRHLRGKYPARYIAGCTQGSEAVEAPSASTDFLYDQAVDLVVADRRASASYLQRRLGIGYNRAADLIERMERDGLVSRSNGAGRREVLVAPVRSPASAA